MPEAQEQAKRRRPIKITLRTALLIALAASFMTFLSQVLVGFVTYHRYESEREASERGLLSRQTILEERIRSIEEARGSEMRVLDERLGGIAAGGEGEDLPVSEGADFPIENVLGSIVEIICLDNADKDMFYTGSGTMVDRTGFVATNHHLLVSSDGSLIRFCGVGFTDDMGKPPRTEYIAETVAVRTESDLAMLQIIESLDGGSLPESFNHISMDNSLRAVRGLKLGDVVYIAGYPGVGAQTFTFTQGVVSGRVGSDLIKTSALVDSGTSGGAAFDIHGNFIGMPTAAARGDIGGSLGYLISADIVESFTLDFYAGKLTDTVSEYGIE